MPANVAGDCRKFKKLANFKKSATIWISRNLSKGVPQEGAERTNSLLNSLSKLLCYTLASNDVLVPLSREIYIVDEYFPCITPVSAIGCSCTGLFPPILT